MLKEHTMIKKSLVIALAVLILSAGFVLAGPFDDPKALLTPENMEKLKKGEPVMVNKVVNDAKGNPRGQGLAVIVVNADPDTCWKYITQQTKMPEFMPRMISATEYMKEGNTRGVKFTIKILLSKISYHIIHTYDKGNYKLSYVLDKSKENDIADTSGFWKIEPFEGGKSLIAYTVSVDTGMAVPKAIQDYLTQKDLPNVVSTMKKRIESGGTYKK